MSTVGSRRYVQRHRGNWVSSSDVSLPVRRRECVRTVHVTGVRKGARMCENRGQRLRAARTQRWWREESRGKRTPTMIILDDDS